MTILLRMTSSLCTFDGKSILYHLCVLDKKSEIYEDLSEYQC